MCKKMLHFFYINGHYKYLKVPVIHSILYSVLGSISTLHIPTLADSVEPEKLPGAIGLLMAFAGTGQFCGPPIAGILTGP